MTARYISAVFRVGVITLAIATASAQSPPAQTPAPQSQAGARLKRRDKAPSAPIAPAPRRSVTRTLPLPPRAGDNSATLAGDSSVNAVLEEPVHSGKSKPGDPVHARTHTASQDRGWETIP
jgi:hypothetical protein